MVIDVEIIGKLAGFGGTIVTIGKCILKKVSERKSKMREEYQFSNDFLGSMKSDEPVHPFVIEKGYQALAGSKKVKAREVRYILELEDAAERLQQFVDGYDYVQHLSTQGGKEISFRAKYLPAWKLEARRKGCFVAYFVSFFLAFVPFVFQKELGLTLPQVGLVMCFTVPMCLPYAFRYLKKALSIRSAQQLVALQSPRSTQSTL